MADLLFNNSGVPLMGYGSKSGIILATTGTPETKPKLAEPKSSEIEKLKQENQKLKSRIDKSTKTMY